MTLKRIGIACNRLASGGGMESHALSIITELSNLGYEPVIFTKNHKPVPSVANFEVFSCFTKWMPRIIEDHLFSRWLKNAKAEANINTCIGFCRNTESDILFCGGTHKGFAQSRGTHSLYDKVTICFENESYQKAKFILPASKFIAKELQSLYGVDKEKIVVAYPPVCSQKFKIFSEVEKRQARIELGLDPEKLVLLFPSASGHGRKGLPFILNCLNGLSDIQLAVAGKLPKAQNTAIVSIGYQCDMSRVYNAADFTILASYYEPFGLVGVESVLCGTPVILADGIGCTEVLSRNACQTFSRNTPEELHSILANLKPRAPTSVGDIRYDLSPESQAQMLTSLLLHLNTQT